MSFRSERRIRSVIVASTGLSLLGAASVFVNFGSASGAFSMSEAAGGTSAAMRHPPRPTDTVKALPASADRWFRPATGKQNRADIIDARSSTGAEPQPEIITASMVSVPQGIKPLPEAAPRPALAVHQDVNRGTKGDRLPVPMAVAKFTVPAGDQVNVRASAAVFLVSPPLADASGSENSEPNASAPKQAAPAKLVESQSADAGQTASVKGPVDNSKLAAADMRPGGKSYWDDLVKMASIKGDGAGEKPVFFGGFTEKEEHARQLRCMATAIYFEARDEPLRGQIAVAQVIMTRIKSEFYPKTICEVVYQGSQNRNACQFSFACDGKADVVREKKEWATALDVARQVISGKVYLTDIGASTHYHATYVHPDWRKQVKKIKQIGTHIFYKADFAPPLVANADYSKL